MNHFLAWQFVKTFRNIDEIYCDAMRACDKGQRDALVPAEWITRFIAPSMEVCKRECAAIELEHPIERLNGPLRLFLKNGMTFDQLRNEMKQLRHDIEADLWKRYFAFVPQEKAKLLIPMDDYWKRVWLKIPDAKQDTEDAVTAYALGLNTACVFHLMRIAEMGLRKLAKRVPAKLKHGGKHSYPIEYADWGTVISAIKDEIDKARKTIPPGAKRQSRLEFYSDAADHCLFMKDIWRNNISHARKPYIESEALGVMDRVKNFMEFLAEHLS